MAERVQQELEANKKIFGIPAFRHTSAFRSVDGEGTWEEWLAPARPLDSDHKFDNKVVDDLLQEILDDPPEMPAEKDSSEDTSVVDAEKEVE